MATDWSLHGTTSPAWTDFRTSQCPMCKKTRIDSGSYCGDPLDLCPGHRVEAVLDWHREKQIVENIRRSDKAIPLEDA